MVRRQRPRDGNARRRRPGIVDVVSAMTLGAQTRCAPKALTNDKRETMANKSNFVLLFAFAAVGVAFPAFAQSFDPEAGTGNVLPFNDGAPAARNYPITPLASGKIAARHNGLYGYTTIPRRRQIQ